MTAHARVETGRASRYLAQLCEHLNQMTQHHMHVHDGTPPAVERVEWSDSDGVIDFDCGRCTLLATGDALTLSVDATDQQSQRRIQDVLTLRVQTIGRRDDLNVTWQ